MSDVAYDGLLLIGDAHLEGRQPGFRKDDYPNAILNKLQWCLNYATEHRLLPALLGDLFDKPRDNPNWLIGRLIEMFRREVLGIYGNHDVHFNPELTDDDSLSLLVKSGQIRLLSTESPWIGGINGRSVVVGGSSYRQPLPKSFSLPFELAEGERPLVIWLTHHDILIPGYDEGRIKPVEIPGVDLVVNGHIHRRLEDVSVGNTRWVTPGSICRRSRSDAVRSHVPSAVRVNVSSAGYRLECVEIPHSPFEEVFHETVIDSAAAVESSAFVAGLAELQARRTTSGAGLIQFLEQNMDQFDDDVATEIRALVEETADG